ncbi:hypothetical protein M9Y10_021363 [Tritrichomonas musculus]|uniref:Uncharacterized protein n=1 Tax=Tritrichomonas musculus TaxID=1915356 RepID=A0ABR2HEM7_9EUKA
MTSIISVIVASQYAIKRENNLKCLNYIFDGYKGALNWSVNQSLETQNNLEEWHSNMLNKAFKKNGDASEYYCYQVGIPALLFAVIFFVDYIVMIPLGCLGSILSIGD